jgi:hypothetical protein
MDKELQKLKREINLLKKKKEKKLRYSNSYKEKNELLKEIRELEVVEKNPSMLKSFGKTFGQGLKTTGKSLWSAMSKGSRNLQKNSPEYRELSRDTKSNKPFSRVAKMYLPKQKKKKMKKSKVKSKMLSKKMQPAWELP